MTTQKPSPKPCPHKNLRTIVLRNGTLRECLDCGRVLDPEPIR